MTPTIGVFDSGFGGLTVLRALIQRIPHARFAFIGDTARLPYGSKSRRTIARYAAQSARFLVDEQGAEFLVIACNTASALALDAIKDAVSSSIEVIGVIEPGAQTARRVSKTGDVLVIATDATVQSHAYATACRALGLRAHEKACPLLVPLVEEGWVDFPLRIEAGTAQAGSAPSQVAVTAEVVRIYLQQLLSEAASQGLKPDTLVLGCTHYPLIRSLIEQAIPAGITIIDSAESAAHKLATHLGHNVGPSLQLPASDPILRFFATDSVEKFERLGSTFLGRPVGNVELVDLGG